MIGLGKSHTCVVMSGGGVNCWGDNEYGQLGIGEMLRQSGYPMNVSGA